MNAYFRDVLRIVERRSLLALLSTSILVTLLEAASVSVVIPAVGLIVGGKVPALVREVLQTLGIEADSTQKVALLCAIAAVFVIRGTLLGLILLTQSRITFNAQRRLSGLLFERFLTARFERVTDVASSTLVRTSTTELANITHGILLPISTLASEFALVLGSTLVLLTLQPLAALGLVLGTAALSLPITRLNRSRLSRYGKVRHAMEDNRVRVAQEIVSGVREVKIYRLEQQLMNAIEGTNATYSRIMSVINFLQNLPRIYFETSGIGLLLIICAYQLANDVPPAQILMFLTVAGLAAFRALPSVAKVLAQLQALRFYRPALTNLLDLLDTLEPAMPAAGSTREPAEARDDRELRIELTGATYRHTADGPDVFHDVNLLMKSGEIVGLVGPSGIGKSTLLDCLLGLRRLASGEVSIVDEANGKPVVPHVSYVPQNPVMMDATIWRNIVLAQSEHAHPDAEDPRLKESLHLSGLDELMRSRGLLLTSKVVEGGRNLSGGQRQRLALTRALYRAADVLVLDEATSALDREAERAIIDRIRKQQRKRLVILVTHQPELLRYCDKVVRMEPGGRVTVAATALTADTAGQEP